MIGVIDRIAPRPGEVLVQINIVRQEEGEWMIEVEETNGDVHQMRTDAIVTTMKRTNFNNLKVAWLCLKEGIIMNGTTMLYKKKWKISKIDCTSSVDVVDDITKVVIIMGDENDLPHHAAITTETITINHRSEDIVAGVVTIAKNDAVVGEVKAPIPEVTLRIPIPVGVRFLVPTVEAGLTIEGDVTRVGIEEDGGAVTGGDTRRKVIQVWIDLLTIVIQIANGNYRLLFQLCSIVLAIIWISKSITERRLPIFPC